MIRYIIRLGEISLKKNNRKMFEYQLKRNIKAKLRPYHTIVNSNKGRTFLDVSDDCPYFLVDKALSTTFGIVGFARCYTTSKNMEYITKTVLKLINDVVDNKNCTYKIEAKRADKRFSLKSYDIAVSLASSIYESYPSMNVDVKNPDYAIHVEIRDQVYIYTNDKKGLNGLPVLSSGKSLLLLSGGIDSPVAGFRMAKRGLGMDCVYFHAYPYTSDEAKEKVIELARRLSIFTGGTKLYIVPFTDCQLHIKKISFENENTLLMRICMVLIAQSIAKKNNITSLITGEALSQVASQTLESLILTDSYANMPVFRPLIGMDKEEIITTSKEAEFYETSILPFEDCCTIFSPKHPLVKPKLEVLQEHFEKMGIEKELEKAVNDAEVITFTVDSKALLK